MVLNLEVSPLLSDSALFQDITVLIKLLKNKGKADSWKLVILLFELHYVGLLCLVSQYLSQEVFFTKYWLSFSISSDLSKNGLHYLSHK